MCISGIGKVVSGREINDYSCNTCNIIISRRFSPNIDQDWDCHRRHHEINGCHSCIYVLPESSLEFKFQRGCFPQIQCTELGPYSVISANLTDRGSSFFPLA